MYREQTPCLFGDFGACGVGAGVCDNDNFCCQTLWGSSCADEVESNGCGDCGSGFDYCGDGYCWGDETCKDCPEDCGQCGGTGDCGETQSGPGCDDPSVQACVCWYDSFCCNYVWDQACADAVEKNWCGWCETPDPCGGMGPGADDIQGEMPGAWRLLLSPFPGALDLDAEVGKVHVQIEHRIARRGGDLDGPGQVCFRRPLSA